MTEKSEKNEHNIQKEGDGIAQKEMGDSQLSQAVSALDDAAQKLTMTMEHMRIGEYVQYLNHPAKLLWTNFLIGLARGLGGTIGLAIVLAVLFFVLQELIMLNLPFLSEWLSSLIYSIQENLQYFN